MNISETIKSTIKSAIKNLAIEADIDLLEIHLEHPSDLSNGDFSTSIALSLSKKLNKNPKVFAEELVGEIEKNKPSEILKIEVAGPGFINFYLDDSFFFNSIKQVIENNSKDSLGKNKIFEGKMVAVEYTDPNPFKQFHIGHLMTNIIGEALSRLYDFSGANVKRLCYQGDVGRHVALTIWGFRFMDKAIPSDDTPLSEKTAYLGAAYALGSKKVKEDPTAEIEVKEINKKIYERSDDELNEIYDKGREWSLEHFEEIYKVLGTNFDHYFFESQSSPVGKKIVEDHLANEKGNSAVPPALFEKSDGAVIFSEAKSELHTRVFLTSEGLTTYEGKELGLAKIKYESFPYDLGITVTANEQNDYFKVIFKAMSFIFPEIAKKSEHLSHGMLRLSVGPNSDGKKSQKMSSRTGDVVTGESLLADMIQSALEKVSDRPGISEEDKHMIASEVGVAAIKYTILKQSVGKDIIFDKEKSLSFEGDSGPYLQYSHVRAVSILEKSKLEMGDGLGDENEENKSDNSEKDSVIKDIVEKVSKLERKLYRFSEIVQQSCENKAPHTLAQFLLEIASDFNSFYASTPILNAGALKDYRLDVVRAFASTMKNGLWILGISAPDKM